MAETAAEKQVPRLQPKPLPKQISWEDFRRSYLSREDKYKYEWVNGLVEKTPRNIDKSQFFILVNLMRFLQTLKISHPQIDGELIAEGDTFFAGNHRRPDIAYYAEAQIREAKKGSDVVPKFVVEVISKQDQIEKLEKKMEDYAAADVQVVWLVFPGLKKVHVYHGRRMEVCRDEDLCSAEPVIPGFVLPARQIFE